MWAFVLFETLIFTGYFSVYLLQRTGGTAGLPGRAGAAGPAHRGVQHRSCCYSARGRWRAASSPRAGAYGSAHRDALLTVLFGVVFAVSKVSEWIRQLGRGNGIAGNEFFTFSLPHRDPLPAPADRFRRPGHRRLPDPRSARRSQNLIETGATYWHTVDFLWVLIFALLYVVR